MKNLTYLLLSFVLLVSIVCCQGTHTPEQEQRLAHDYLWQANKTSVEKAEERNALYDKAALHFANIVVRSDANDILRADALFTLRWISAYIRHDYDMALQYLNQYLEIVGPEHESYPTCLAYKADDLWHFGAHDSAIHYAYKALEAPHTPQDRIEYICHHILWNIYESRELPDSAHRHKALHMHIRDSRAFEPMSMEELKSQLETDILASSKDDGDGVSVWVALAGCLAVLCLACACVFYLKRKKNNAFTDIVGSADSAMPTSATVIDTETLKMALAKGCQAFATTSVCHDINAMKVNERELPAINSETRRNIERTLLECFAETCHSLLAESDLNEQELICLLCMHLGCSNTVISHLGHTTNATIRKRKERIRKKISAALYEIIAGEL
ncbi:MAG: hypothetical protein J6S05_02740 [Bacteroidaceae bacterium]|nr:hypothetical protein [Bacteroidaceae bacterium]